MRETMRFTAAHFAMASALILLAFALSEGMQGLREVILPHPVSRIRVIFLPFGAIVLLTWIYGWAAMPLALPASLLAMMAMQGSAGLTWALLGILAVKLTAVPVSFDLFRRAGLDARGEGRAANWRVLMMVGLLAALIGNVPRVAMGRCCEGFSLTERMSAYVTMAAADVAGLLLVLLGAMAVFRALRQG